jgi:hypothetical protein
MISPTASRLCWLCLALLGLGLIPFGRTPAVAAQEVKPPDACDVARRVDALLDPKGDPADDASFLRRLKIDLTGQVPDAEELRTYLADTSANKRSEWTERFLTSQAYAVNWGRYWRDVLTYYTPASGNYLRWQLFDRWMVEQFERNRSWGEIVTTLVTATGINDEYAPVNFLTAQYGNPIEIAATTSRVFLGVQLQCAQCHNAKTESWKREQFHELVAFYGRAKLIQHKDVNGRGTPYAIEGREDGQHFMPDKRDPNKLIPMTPRFLTGETVSIDTPDSERRTALARFLTSPKNPWFAKAYVNRMWSALMGWGFYPTVADLGSDTPPRYPEVLELLAKEWTGSGYDPHWLFRTIVQTRAYQSRLQPRPDSQSIKLAAVCPSRLRPEQIFEALVKTLGFDENDKQMPAPAPSSGPAVSRHSGLRHMVYMAFKVDPSLPPEEVQGTIPQALLMMNSVMVNTYIRATGKTFLAQKLKENLSDDDIVKALYLRALARQPRAEEMEICRRYIARVEDRREALEDIFWGLVNSTEFLTRR